MIAALAPAQGTEFFMGIFAPAACACLEDWRRVGLIEAVAPNAS
jgi:hypothetical protein